MSAGCSRVHVQLDSSVVKGHDRYSPGRAEALVNQLLIQCGEACDLGIEDRVGLAVTIEVTDGVTLECRIRTTGDVYDKDSVGLRALNKIRITYPVTVKVVEFRTGDGIGRDVRGAADLISNVQVERWVNTERYRVWTGRLSITSRDYLANCVCAGGQVRKGIAAIGGADRARLTEVQNTIIVDIQLDCPAAKTRLRVARRATPAGTAEDVN